MIESDNVTDNVTNPPFLLASKMAAKMREEE